MKRGADGNYYVLSAPGSTAAVFDAAGKLLRRVPAYDEGKGPGHPVAPIGHDYLRRRSGCGHARNVYVADRGANAIKIWDTKGNERVIRMNATDGGRGAAGRRSGRGHRARAHLVMVFDKNGRDVREFGDPEPISERPEVNRFLNIGMLVTDGSRPSVLRISILAGSDGAAVRPQWLRGTGCSVHGSGSLAGGASHAQRDREAGKARGRRRYSSAFSRLSAWSARRAKSGWRSATICCTLTRKEIAARPTKSIRHKKRGWKPTRFWSSKDRSDHRKRPSGHLRIRAAR